jgi:hypothetical protein
MAPLGVRLRLPVATDDESLDLDLIAASLRADLADVNAFVEGLAVKLEDAIPGATVIKRARSGFRGPKQVVGIAVDLAGMRLLMDRRGDHLQTAKARTSGGIVLKTEEVDVDQWLTALTAALAAEAQRSQRIRQALEGLLM